MAILVCKPNSFLNANTVLLSNGIWVHFHNCPVNSSSLLSSSSWWCESWRRGSGWELLSRERWEPGRWTYILHQQTSLQRLGDFELPPLPNPGPPGKPPNAGGGPPIPAAGPYAYISHNFFRSLFVGHHTANPTAAPLPAGLAIPAPAAIAAGAPPGALAPRRELGSAGGGDSTEREIK